MNLVVVNNKSGSFSTAIINKPKILLLDEPLSNVDTELRAHLRSELKEMIKHLILLHYLLHMIKKDAFYLSDRIGIMHMGNILQSRNSKTYLSSSSRFILLIFLVKWHKLGKYIYKTWTYKNLY